MIQAGTRLGPYEVLAPIGAGGMGEVWRGRDTRLDRSVAIKILPAEFAQNAQFKARFEREARAISQLNHPNICTLYDVGEDYLVMELLEGESLADRLSKGPLPLEQVLRYGLQIADALDKAHRNGIIHRDLKPGNIMITKSGAKLLDFGLAKGGAPPPSAAMAGEGAGPTLHKPLTQEGTILGTFQYMAPEQLEGEEADARTDIFAFGALLYEMATGRRAFEGKTKTSLIAAIVKENPRPMAELQPLTPPALEHVVSKCLSKDPDDRWQSAHDIAEELKWIGSAPEVTQTGKKRSAALAIVATAIIATVIGLAAGRFIGRPRDGHVVRFTIPTTDGPYHDARLTSPSPDGKRLIIPAFDREGVGRLFMRRVDSLDVQPIPGTEGSDNAPLFGTSPKWLLFSVGRRLKKLDLDARTVETVSDNAGFGTSINDDGTVLYPAGNVIVMKGRDAAPRAVTQLDRAAKEASHRWPTFLPDGKHFLFVARGDVDAPRPGVLYLASIDSPKRIAVTDSLFRSVYAGGYLFLPRETKLMAFPFDAKRGAITGSGVVVAEKINTFTDDGWAAFNVTETGVLTYRIRTDESKLVWMDQNGRTGASVGGVAGYGRIRISPDGKRVAVSIEDRETQTDDIWIFGIDRQTAEQVTTDRGNEDAPVWSPDGRRLAYLSYDATGSGRVSLHIHALDGGPDEVIATGQYIDLVAWSGDGKRLVCNALSPARKPEISTVDVEGGHTQTALIPAAFGEINGRPSGDGRLLLFESSVSGKDQVYVVPRTGAGERIQVSADGGVNARWSADGKHVYFVSNTAKMMVADVTVSDRGVTVSEPRQLFQASFSFSEGDYDVAADGRFLVTAPVERSEWAPTAVIVNWQQALREHQ